MADEITLDLPAPPPGNKLRRIDWRHHDAHMAWRKAAGNHLLLARSGGKKLGAMIGRFEIELTVDEHKNRTDLDSLIKAVADFCVVNGLVMDDAPRYMRKVTIQWGVADEGIRVVLRPWGGE